MLRSQSHFPDVVHYLVSSTAAIAFRQTKDNKDLRVLRTTFTTGIKQYHGMRNIQYHGRLVEL